MLTVAVIRNSAFAGSGPRPDAVAEGEGVPDGAAVLNGGVWLDIDWGCG
jgi:hypothetical protein